MRLRFNIGAVVELTVLGNRRTSRILGKVEKVFPDEVVIRVQRRIFSERKLKGSSMREILMEEYVTCDSKEVIHVNRQLIKTWRYANISEFDAITQTPPVIRPGWREMNGFDEYGFCKGKGAYCGDIEEKYDQPIVILCNDDVNRRP